MIFCVYLCVCVCVPGDEVYLPDESLLQEYVMNEDGVIYMGTWDYINSIPWNYGQVTLAHRHQLCVCKWVVCVSVRPVGGLCELSQQCDSGDSGASAGSGNLFVGWSKLLDGRCQNVTKPHKQGLVPSQLAGRAERKINR